MKLNFRHKKVAVALLGLQLTLLFIAPAVPAQAAVATNPDLPYLKVWERADYPVAFGSAQRSWYWGPAPFMVGKEGYSDAPLGNRQVQYWDKSRMEVTNPYGNTTSKYYVTNGLLVRELVTGKMQVGDNDFLTRFPADVPVAGDTAEFNPDAPTYASFKDVVDVRANRNGSVVSNSLNKSGSVSPNASLTSRYPETASAYYEDKLGHNIPAPFWQFMNASGTVIVNQRPVNQVIEDWLFAFGYPIGEAYWTRSRVAGVEKDVLVQLFERRILTYTPSNPAAYRVEMGNVGRHYYTWRYGNGGGLTKAPAYAEPITRIAIPAITVDAAIEYVGVNSKGEMDVPNGPQTAAWYKAGARVGEPGNAVITAHVDYINYGPAIFYNLKKLQTGDLVYVTTTTGTKLTFKVTGKESFPADSVPTERIFAADTVPHLNLVTCTGTFQQSLAGYTDRIVVFTTLVS